MPEGFTTSCGSSDHLRTVPPPNPSVTVPGVVLIELGETATQHRE